MAYFKQEFKRVVIGVIIADIISALVFALLGCFDLSLLFGVIFGSVFTLLKFALLITSSIKAIYKSPTKAKSYMSIQYFVRFLFTAVAIAIAVEAEYLNTFAAILPIISVRISLGIPIKQKGE